MASSKHTTAGGFPIAIGALGGTIVGLIVRQPSIGFLGGLALGTLIALAIWLKER